MIYQYFNEIEYLVQYNPLIKKSDIQKIRINDFSGIIKGNIYFDGFVLNFIEVLDLDNNPSRLKIKYKYHFMDINGSIIFRYDNVKHYPNIKSFPHHKHIFDKTIESVEPDLKYIFKEIKNHILSISK